jgi:hypothetical protein
MRTPILFLASAALVVAGLVWHATARANGTSCTAFIGGIQTDKATAPELVIFNTTAETMTLDLVLRAPNGTALVTTPAAFTLTGHQTGFFDLKALLATKGLNGKAYLGTFSAEVTGAPPFSENDAVIHVTQYFGSRKKPKSAFVIRPVFNPVIL